MGPQDRMSRNLEMRIKSRSFPSLDRFFCFLAKCSIICMAPVIYLWFLFGEKT